MGGVAAVSEKSAAFLEIQGLATETGATQAVKAKVWPLDVRSDMKSPL